MFVRSIELFKVLGISIRLHLSWFVIAALIAWSQAGLFREKHPGLADSTYWAMGIAGALGLFASIALHELAHALTARRFGLHMRAITLFIFGGVAEMADEPPTPKSEFWIAIAGPVASVLIAGCFLGMEQAGIVSGLPGSVVAVLGWLWVMNLALALFNLVPAFPLDGGRVLRSVLWRIRGDLRWATRITSEIGAGFGMVLIVLGLANLVFLSNPVAGMWQALIGMFLRGAARSSYQQLLMRRWLAEEPVEHFMHTDVHCVPSNTTIAEFVNEYVYRYGHESFPIIEQGKVLGYASTADVRKVPRDQWSGRMVEQIASPLTSERIVEGRARALEALDQMNRAGSPRLLVLDHGELRGLLSLSDLLRFASLKLSLEGDGVTKAV